MIRRKTVIERVEGAKKIMPRVVDHFQYVIELHENNAIIVYSPILADQIPHSFAANAFNVFQRGMHQFEMLRLCALWDTADEDKENIPTVVELIDDPDVIQALAEETRCHWAHFGGTILNPATNAESYAAECESLRRGNEQFGDEQAGEAVQAMKEAIASAREILDSTKLKSVLNLRNKHIAHSLARTRAEKAGPIDPVKYGDERALLEMTCPIVEKLYLGVNGRSICLADFRETDRHNAHALWDRCRFDIVH
jgi:hypothetical protein